jgi:pimeloyl-ACP methyl ester carboxylesterase
MRGEEARQMILWLSRSFGGLLATAALLCAGCDDLPLDEEVDALASSVDREVERTEVCFTAHNPGDPTPQQIRGTLFHTKGYKYTGSTALLLQHGAASERTAWNGGRPILRGVRSMAVRLAAAGYAVFAIDRLGYGQSTYSGSGFALNQHGYVEMTHEMVAQIRAGTYGVTADTCANAVPADRAASRVVLAGFSLGALVTELYATRYHDIDGIVGMSWSNQGFSSEFNAEIGAVVFPQLSVGKDHFVLFPAESDGYSIGCEAFLFYDEGVSDRQLQQACGPRYWGDEAAHTTPSGEFIGVGEAIGQVHSGLGLVGPTPVFLVFGDRDALFPNADYGGLGGANPDLVTPEMDMWSNQCNCDVSFQFQQDSGHAGWMLHYSMPRMTDSIIDWLQVRGL